MSEDQMRALSTAIGHLLNGLDPEPARNHPLSDEARGAREARKVLDDAGFTLPPRPSAT